MPFVNAYAVGRAYGGPEEGGWWYDYGDLIESVYVKGEHDDDATEAVIGRVKSRLWSDHGWTSEHDRYSMLGSEDFAVYVEDEPGQSFPAETPHYE